jgi:hypothetical protein
LRGTGALYRAPSQFHQWKYIIHLLQASLVSSTFFRCFKNFLVMEL